VPLPAVLSVATACNEPRFMDYGIKSWAFAPEQLTVWSADDLDVDEAYIGTDGSPTIVSGLDQAPSRERKRIFIDGPPREAAIQLANIIQGD
jgi:electron transfer flavoprotein alpha/beta subunit